MDMSQSDEALATKDGMMVYGDNVNDSKRHSLASGGGVQMTDKDPRKEA